ncbi:iron exporter MbfA [soil metagenome]
MSRKLSELDEREVLALAVALEEQDARIYGDYAEKIKTDYPETAQMLTTMQAEEEGHAASLRKSYQAHYGQHVPHIDRHDVSGFIRRKPPWLAKVLTIPMIRREIEVMELESMDFYKKAARQTPNAAVKQLFLDLAAAEQKHEDLAGTLVQNLETSGGRAREDETQRRAFVLQIIQPGLAGLMDGSVSTLAPVFAAAFATHNSKDAFLVGMAASIGAGISMGFAEALSDDGVISGRGRPYIRGAICGLMTTLGGVGHTFPFLISNFYLAMWIAVAVVAVELAVISWIRHRYMDTPLLSATFQVVVGGVLVFITGILIGSAG